MKNFVYAAIAFIGLGNSQTYTIDTQSIKETVVAAKSTVTNVAMDTDFLGSLSLQGLDISTITCSEINALSESDFDILIRKIQNIPVYFYSCEGNIFEGTPEYKEWEEAAHKSVSQVEFILIMIHKCRSIVPVYNRMISEELKEMSDQDFDCFLEKAFSLYAYCDQNYPSLSDLERIFIDAKDEFLLHPNNVEKLRKLRTELRDKLRDDDFN